MQSLPAVGVASIVLAGALIAQPATAPRLPKDDLDRGLFEQPIPLGLDLAGNSAMAAKELRPRFALGRRLFFDPILSSDRSVSCASCHDPKHGFSSPEALPPGVSGRHAVRNAPTLFNRGFGQAQSWDGSSPNLVHQVTRPIANPKEMDLPLQKALQRLQQDKAYASLFANTYKVLDADSTASAVSKERLADALASFVGRLYLADSPVDRFRLLGERGLLNTPERAGMWIWESKGRCWKCHSGGNFADEQFHNTGVGAKDGVPRPGRQAVTGKASDLGRFKTPTLRGLVFTAPYMHDGSLKTLEEVVEFYRRGGNPNKNLDPDLQPLNLTDEDARNLVAFLKALSRRAPGPLQKARKVGGHYERRGGRRR